MLLTSGQISMTISSCIVFVFTSVLFLSGYILQQQTVRSLQAAIHPQFPGSPASAASAPTPTVVPRPFGQRTNVIDTNSYNESSVTNESRVNWSKLAYVQLTRRHLHVCNAVMAFADLAQQRSPAERVLLYPGIWDREFSSGDATTRNLETSMRLLRRAKARYSATLIPIEPLLDIENDDIERAYPTAGLLSLTSFDRLIYMEPSGLILGSSVLDTLFTLPNNSTLMVFSEMSLSPSPLALITPSVLAHRKIIDTLSSISRPESEVLNSITEFFQLEADQTRRITQTSSLKFEDDASESRDFFSQAAYVRISDPDILGPEYDIPMDIFHRSRPQEFEARRAWEGLYEIYRMKRMEICGLDLEPMPVPHSGIEEMDSKRPDPAVLL